MKVDRARTRRVSASQACARARVLACASASRACALICCQRDGGGGLGLAGSGAAACEVRAREAPSIASSRLTRRRSCFAACVIQHLGVGQRLQQTLHSCAASRCSALVSCTEARSHKTAPATHAHGALSSNRWSRAVPDRRTFSKNCALGVRHSSGRRRDERRQASV